MSDCIPWSLVLVWIAFLLTVITMSKVKETLPQLLLLYLVALWDYSSRQGMQQQVQNLALSDTKEKKKKKKVKKMLLMTAGNWEHSAPCRIRSCDRECFCSKRNLCETPHLHISNLIKRKTHLWNSAVFYSKQNKVFYLQMESLLCYGQNCEISPF